MIWSTILGYAFIQAFVFFVVLFFHDKGNRMANRLLSWILLIFGILLLDDWLDQTFGWEAFPHLIFVEGPLWYLLAPLIFLYLKSYTHSPLKLKWFDLLHLLPFLWILYNNLGFYSFSASNKVSYLKQFLAGTKMADVHNLSYIIFWVQTFIYVIWALFTLHHFKQKLVLACQETVFFSKWLKQVLLIIVVLFLLASCNFIVVNWAQHYNYSLNILYALVLLTSVLTIFYKTIRNSEDFFLRRVPLFQNDNITFSPITTYPVISNLYIMMEREKPFLNAEYNIHQLAKSLNMSVNKATHTIKSQTKMNFRDFINQYRIKEAKKRLIDPSLQHYTIHTIAKDVGFKSYVTFYRVFKKTEGLTPKEYLNQFQNEADY